MNSKEKILEEFDKKLLKVCDVYEKAADNNSEKLENWEKERKEIKQFISQAIDQTRKETIRNEIEYWEGVFDNRPKDRDLESDNIAQNFARIEIERLQSLINLLK
jgi:hypothetical protein